MYECHDTNVNISDFTEVFCGRTNRTVRQHANHDRSTNSFHTLSRGMHVPFETAIPLSADISLSDHTALTPNLTSTLCHHPAISLRAGRVRTSSILGTRRESLAVKRRFDRALQSGKAGYVVARQVARTLYASADSLRSGSWLGRSMEPPLPLGPDPSPQRSLSTPFGPADGWSLSAGSRAAGVGKSWSFNVSSY